MQHLHNGSDHQPETKQLSHLSPHQLTITCSHVHTHTRTTQDALPQPQHNGLCPQVYNFGGLFERRANNMLF